MRLNQITIPVKNITQSVEFYSQFGLELIVLSDDYARFVNKESNTTFSLHQVNELPTGEGVWIYFETEQIDEKVQELITQGYTFEEMPNDKPWLWREARLKDLDGNQIIIYHAGENRLNPPWRIKEKTKALE